MAAKPPSASTLPWIWVIETLANFKQIDASVLIDFVKRTQEISDDLGKNAREMVSLSILESLFAQTNGITSGASSASDSKIGFDPSDCCEDVSLRILCEMSASNSKMDGPEMLKWDVQPFIMHKRACLPKCALQQLKDAILEGNPILASLKEKSGLAIRNQSENRIPADDGDLNPVARRLGGSGTYGQAVAAQGNLISLTPENRDGLLRENSPDRNLLLSKRDNLAAQFHEDQISMDNGHDPHLHAAKKLKQGVTCTSETIDQNSVLLHGNELIEDLSGRVGQHTGREGCDLGKGSQVGGVEKSRFSEDNHGEHLASKRLGQSNDADDDDFQHNHLQISYNENKAPQDTSVDGQHQSISVGEAKDDNERCAETRTLNGAPPDVTHHNISVDEARGNCEHSSQLNTSNGAPPDGSHWKFFADEAKDNMEHNCEPEMSSDSDGYHDEKIDIAMKKHTFLSSQCTHNQDSLATSGWTELNLCMKCNKSGQLLVCSASACPLVVHESCLGAASFDDRGNFYCPFCAYSLAISEYLEVKKKASSARKDLAGFIGFGNEHRPKKLPKRLRSKQNQVIQNEDVDGNNEANCYGNYVNKVNNSQFRTNIEDKQQAKPSASCVNDNLPRGEKGATIIDGTLRVLTEDNRQGEKMGQECQLSRVREGQQIKVRADHKHDGNNSSCRDTEIAHASERRAEVGVQQDALRQVIADSPHKAACPPTNIDAEESSEEDDDKSIASNYSIRFRKRKKQYTYPAIPQLRRKKVPWTLVEQELLEEGVRRFSSVHDKSIPWKKILEFGRNVFQKGRTTIDLKDKWRNICRSPKSK